MRTSIEERPEPPRMDRRWCVFTMYNNGSQLSAESWSELRTAAKTIGNLGLVAELQVEKNDVALFAARRKKAGKKKE